MHAYIPCYGLGFLSTVSGAIDKSPSALSSIRLISEYDRLQIVNMDISIKLLAGRCGLAVTIPVLGVNHTKYGRSQVRILAPAFFLFFASLREFARTIPWTLVPVLLSATTSRHTSIDSSIVLPSDISRIGRLL
jgi:hypothetical protein